MGNILTASITISGTRPLLWNHFTADVLSGEKREKTGVAGNDPEEWRRTVLVTDDGTLFLDPSYVFGAVRDGAKHTRRGLQAAIAATLQINDDCILLNRRLPPDLTTDRTSETYLDVRPVRNPKTKGRNLRYRVATKPGWLATFSMLWDATVVSRDHMHAAVLDAGALVGVGDGRNMGMGRFRLEGWTVQEYKAERS